MFSDMKITQERPAYIQIKDYIKQMISRGMLQKGQKLPSTRELAAVVHVGRNTVIAAYNCLEDEGFIQAMGNKGVFVSFDSVNCAQICNIDWPGIVTPEARLAEQLDIMKHGITYEKGMIAFTSIAPDERFFDMDNLKRAFLDVISTSGEKILNYGYAKGYRPLAQYLLRYMEGKGTDISNKDILITNGFTEALDLLLSVFCTRGQKIICQNPTHNTAIKIIKLHGLEPVGVTMDDDGMNLEELSERLSGNDIKLAYVVPSYHNPTGIVMSPQKRMEMLKLFGRYSLPVVEDGFNEELRYSGSHIAPLVACCGKGNNVIYTGSFSKILFPGLRIGWIIADTSLINYLESLKRSRNIHTSTLDQALLFQYLQEGNFERYVSKVRKIYKQKYDLAVSSTKEFIPCRKISGEGGLHIFVELESGIDSRLVLERCYKRGVVFTPGDIFFTDNTCRNTLRLGFSRLSNEDIRKGIKIIGEVVRELL